VVKAAYLNGATAPLDGVWLLGFVPLAKHFSFHINTKLAGYGCINDDGFLLQYYLRGDEIVEGSSLMSEIVAGSYKQLPTRQY